MIFDNRTLNSEEVSCIKTIIQDTIECLNQIKDLQDHMKENLKGVCDRVNENVADKELWIKPSLLSKIARARMKEDLSKQKEDLSDVELGLDVIFGK